MADGEAHLTEQMAYYRARAPEYDDWYERRGRYDRGPAVNATWRREVEVVRERLDRFVPTGHVLEIAGGTGLWSRRLARHAQSLTVVDAAPEMLAINRGRTRPLCEARGVPLTLVEADVYAWEPPDGRRYDVVFFSFWLSHVPETHFEAFWDRVRRWLSPDGRVFFVDSRHAPDSMATDHPVPEADGSVAVRKLDDGRTFRVVKRFYEPDALSERLAELGWQVDLGATPTFFIEGSGRPS